MSNSVEKFSIDGPILINGVRHQDERGYFSQIYQSNDFSELGLPIFVQDNLSKSSKGVFRGLHWQEAPYAQGKLVTCINGSIIDFIVDIRENSPTFMEHLAIPLGAETLASLWVPPGFAHGFLSLEDNTLVNYKVDNFWNRESERSLNPQFLDGDSKFQVIESKILSEKDAGAPMDLSAFKGL